MITIKQIGNGGAFDYKSVNSSFLIDTGENSYFLFDCGHSVFAELRRQHDTGEIDLEKLKYVYISHNDDDHNGSLKTLIYFMYFNFGKRLQIIAVSSQYKDLDVYGKIANFTDDIDGFYENDQKIEDDLFNMIPINRDEVFRLDGFTIEPLESFHLKPCYGLLFNCYILKNESQKGFIITGDTKASSVIMDEIKKDEIKFVYHDFSNWDKPGSQVHCCETDFNKFYDRIIQSKVIKYHNNGEFIKEWRTFDEIVVQVSRWGKLFTKKKNSYPIMDTRENIEKLRNASGTINDAIINYCDYGGKNHSSLMSYLTKEFSYINLELNAEANKKEIDEFFGIVGINYYTIKDFILKRFDENFPFEEAENEKK